MSISLKAENREQLGTLASRKIKRQGLIPAVIYSKKGNINLTLNSRDFEQQFEKGVVLTSVIDLEISGKKTRVIAHKVELDPVSDRPIHIDFMLCEENKPIRAKPKIKFTNQDKSPGLKKGGFLHIVARKLEVLCDGEKSIPETIDADVGSLHVGSKFRANNLSLPQGVKLLKKGNFLIASVIGRGKSEDEKTATPAAATTATATTTPSPTKADDKKPEAKK
ncbi:MAG: 50S ribosomal protein L25/general stress protein Ctc [Alphaproteobacteria bacterium]|nr:50S ribosomal protein L25/general stress protein Ctc [Alphaproteobacteria bacterium]